MVQYSDNVKIEKSNNCWKLIINSYELADYMKEVYIKNFNIPPSTEGIDIDNNMVFTFHKDIDDHTFMRHLKTFTPDFLNKKEEEFKKDEKK